MDYSTPYVLNLLSQETARKKEKEEIQKHENMHLRNNEVTIAVFPLT